MRPSIIPNKTNIYIGSSVNVGTSSSLQDSYRSLDFRSTVWLPQRSTHNSKPLYYCSAKDAYAWWHSAGFWVLSKNIIDVSAGEVTSAEWTYAMISSDSTLPTSGTWYKSILITSSSGTFGSFLCAINGYSNISSTIRFNYGLVSDTSKTVYYNGSRWDTKNGPLGGFIADTGSPAPSAGSWEFIPGYFSMTSISSNNWDSGPPKAVTVNWGASTGAASYSLALSNSTHCNFSTSGGTYIASPITGLTGTSTTVYIYSDGNSGGGTLGISAIAGSQTTSGSGSLSFTINPPL